MRKKLSVFALGLVAVIGLAACQNNDSVPSGQALENQQQQQSSESMIANQAIPHFNYSQLRQNLIEIETAQANGVQTTSFFFNQGVKDPVTTCPSIGFAIPNTASLSNPQQVVHPGYDRNGAGNVAISQMDPNGIYTPTSSSGTYVICIDDSGRPYANYFEGFVQTVTGPATWDSANGRVKLLGPPTGGFTKAKH